MSLEIVLQIIGITPVIFGMVWGMIRLVGNDTRTKLDLHIVEDGVQFKQIQEDLKDIKSDVQMLVKHLIDK